MNYAAPPRNSGSAAGPPVAAPKIAVQERPALLSREARRYAICEIIRRSCVPVELSEHWRIAIADHFSTIYLDPGGAKKIVFPVYRATDEPAHIISRGCTSRAAWAYPPAANLGNLIPDFVVPFLGRRENSGTIPIFAATDPEAIVFNFDLPAAALLTLSRVEETISSERDCHGRYPASVSVASKHGFLHRPIVDEYGLALQQAIRCLLPQWAPQPGGLRVKLSHDMDELGIPFSLRTTIAHTLQRYKPNATLMDLLSLFTTRKPAYLGCVVELAHLSAAHSLDSAFYWKASAAGKYDSGYDPEDPKIMSTLCWLEEHGFESGVHPGYETFRCLHKLRAEVSRLRDCIGVDQLGGRQHYLRWLPESWLDWEACGLAYDSSLGFAESIGFRAGTCVPYRPWLWTENREARLLEIPLIAMDRTLAYYMRLTPVQAFMQVLECIERCRAVGGVFTMLWHNEAPLDPLYGDVYLRLLERLSGSARFDWRTPN